MADSISKRYAQARLANPNLKFADFEAQQAKTAVAPTTPKPTLTNAEYTRSVAKAENYVPPKPEPVVAEQRGFIEKDGRQFKVPISEIPKAPEPTKTAFQQRRDGEITQEQYLEQVQQISGQRAEEEARGKGQTPKEGEVFDQYAALRDLSTQRELGMDTASISPFVNEGRAQALRGDAESKAGARPQPPVPPENGWASEEERLQAEANYKTQLADWYKRVGEISQKELGSVSAQVESFADQMSKYEAAIDDLVSNLNATSPDKGRALEEVLSQFGVTGTGNITPEALTAINLLDKNLTPEQFRSEVSKILTSTKSAKNLSAAGVTDNGDSFTLSNGVTFKKGAGGMPDLSVYALPKDANAYDIALMELATNNKIAEGALDSELAQLRDLSASVKRHTKTAKDEIEVLFDTSQAKVDEEKLRALNEIKFKEKELSLAKDMSLDNILEEEAKMEGYMRGQLEAWGAENSTAALAVMSKTKNNFLKQYTQTAQGYDIQLARLSDIETEARMAYTNRVVELSNNKNIALTKLNDGLLDNIDKIFTETSTAYKNRDLKFLQNSKDYFKDVQAIKDAEAKAAADAAKETRDFGFDLMKEYAAQTGFVYEVDQEGNVKPKLDKNGFPIPTLAREKEERLGGVEFNPSGGGDSNGVGGGEATTLKEVSSYLSNVNPDWVKNTGDGKVVYGSPWVHGLDIDGQVGDPVTAPASGTIVRVNNGERPGSGKGFGNNVVIKTDDGKYIQLSHLDSASVSVGDRVEANQTVGTLGNTGFVLDINGNKPNAEQLGRGVGSHLDVTMWNTFGDITDKEEAISKEEAKTEAKSPLASIQATLAIGQGKPEQKASTTFKKVTGFPEVNSAIESILNGRKTLSDFEGTAGERKILDQIYQVKDAQGLVFPEDLSGGTNANFESLNTIKFGDNTILDELSFIDINDKNEVNKLVKDIKNKVKTTKGVKIQGDIDKVIRDYINQFEL